MLNPDSFIVKVTNEKRQIIEYGRYEAMLVVEKLKLYSNYKHAYIEPHSSEIGFFQTHIADKIW